jgi:hypothetical protein
LFKGANEVTCCSAASSPICPCGQFQHPLVISNPPGQTVIAYRPGDFTGFRHALLLPLPGETVLTQPGESGSGLGFTANWRPGAQGDLALQMVEWWAYIADVLTFYSESVATESYLKTARLPESVNRLIRLLGYRPRPGIGATAVVAAIATGPDPFTLPQGFQIQSKPGPGKTPQIFELDADVTITPPAGPPNSPDVQGISPVEPVPSGAPVPVGSDGSILLSGSISSVKKGDRVLLLPTPSSSASGFALANVLDLKHEKDVSGQPITRYFLDPGALASIGDVAQFRLLRTDKSSQVWLYPAADRMVIRVASGAAEIDLLSVIRGILPGDPIVFEDLGSSKPIEPQYGNLISSTEVVWFANPANYDPAHPTPLDKVDPSIPPPPPPSPPAQAAIAIPHTRVVFAWTSASAPNDTMSDRPYYLVRYGWKEVGSLIVPPASTLGGAAPSGSSPVSLGPSASSTFDSAIGPNVLVEDVNGHGAVGVVESPSTVTLQDPVPVLVPPLRVLSKLLNLSRGKTVANEVLGSGNSLVPGQDFTLQNSPVTYLQSPDSLSGDHYSSTVRVWVNQVQWQEVESFYGQPASAQIFVTREDEQGQTHVVFGDGSQGARLPTGVNNVVATYRYGSGADVPAAGSLTVIPQPRPGLRSIRNPVAASGGADPDPPDQVRRYAPRSVLTFNRAVSVDDFEVIAAQTPGVVRAKAGVTFDPITQRSRVTVWVGDDPGTVSDVTTAFAATADPNRPPRVVLAKAVVISVSLTVVTNPRRDGKAVVAAVRSALIDPDQGLMGLNVLGIAQPIYDSEIYAACSAVAGVVAVHSLSVVVSQTFLDPIFVRLGRTAVSSQFRITQEDPVRISIVRPIFTCGNQRHDPGEGAYLFLPDDDHLTLAQETAT